MALTRRSTLAILTALAAHPARARPELRDLAYSDASPRNRLDIHLPPGNGPFPWLLDLHGGGFRAGDKRLLPVPPELLRSGIAVVRMNYRLSSQALWPAQQEDVLTALAFVNRHGGRLGLVPGRAALGGRSAGAFLALSAALTLVQRDRPVRAVVDFYGPVDFGSMDQDLAATETAGDGKSPRLPADSPESAESLLVGYAVGERRAEAAALSPVGRLRGLPAGTALPPLMIRHGDRDRIVPPRQARRLRDAWRQVDPRAAVDYALLPGEGHGTAGFAAAETATALAAFLARHLG